MLNKEYCRHLKLPEWDTPWMDEKSHTMALFIYNLINYSQRCDNVPAEYCDFIGLATNNSLMITSYINSIDNDLVTHNILANMHNHYSKGRGYEISYLGEKLDADTLSNKFQDMLETLHAVKTILSVSNVALLAKQYVYHFGNIDDVESWVVEQLLITKVPLQKVTLPDIYTILTNQYFDDEHPLAPWVVLQTNVNTLHAKDTMPMADFYWNSIFDYDDEDVKMFPLNMRLGDMNGSNNYYIYRQKFIKQPKAIRQYLKYIQCHNLSINDSWIGFFAEYGHLPKKYIEHDLIQYQHCIPGIADLPEETKQALMMFMEQQYPMLTSVLSGALTLDVALDYIQKGIHQDWHETTLYLP